jgi:hypothetical protein
MKIPGSYLLRITVCILGEAKLGLCTCKQDMPKGMGWICAYRDPRVNFHP